MMNIDKFNDGATIQQFSRESLMYSIDGCSVQVVFDYFKAGAFKAGRKVICNSFDEWEECPEGASSTISPETKQKIIERAVEYFKKRNFSVEIVG
jgi:hypothetical protein